MDMKVDKNGQQIEVEADGKQEIVPAGEPLKKKPKKMNKSAKARWDELKKKLDSATAFMPIEDDEDEQGDDQPAENSEQGGSEQESDESQQGLSPEEIDNLHQEMSGEEDQPEGQEEQGDKEEPSVEGEDEELLQALRDHGLSDAEIAHVVHGHQQPIPDPKQEKAKSEALSGQIEAQNMQTDKDQERQLKEEDARTDIEHKKKLHELELKEAAERSGVNSLDKDHKKRMLDLEYEGAKEGSGGGKQESEHKKRMMDLEYENAKGGAGGGKEEAEHKKKMLALEYEVAKQEMQLELEFKKKEHELKLKMMEEQHKQAAKQKQEVSGIKHKQKVAEAKKPPKPMKKSEDEEDEILEKSLPGGWSSNVNKKTKVVNFEHSDHGIVSVMKNPETGMHEVKHSGRLAGLKGVKGEFNEPRAALEHAGQYVHSIHTGKVSPPKMHNISSTDGLTPPKPKVNQV